MHGENDQLGSPSPRDRSWDDPEKLLGVDEARDRILRSFSPLTPSIHPLLDAVGLVLAEDVVADVNVPPFRNSAMDGFAVRAADLRAAGVDNPVALQVIAEVPAGSSELPHVQHGQAARIMTGAPLPPGADSVVRFEETDEYDRSEGEQVRLTTVRVYQSLPRGANVRDAGEDILSGTLVFARGQVLGPPEIGLLASLNRSEVLTHPRPRIGILSTGDEVVELGPKLRPGQIRNSNSYTLAAYVLQSGGEPILMGVAMDSVEAIRSRLRDAHKFDLILTSGGVSIGDFDVVKRVLQTEGSIDIWQVRIKPGKPMAFGHIGSTPLIGLPGNPVAAAIAYLQFARPAVRIMLGFENPRPIRVRAQLLNAQDNRGRRRHFVRGWIARTESGWTVRSIGSQGSAVLSSVMRANCLIVLPEDCNHVPAGSMVDVELFEGDSLTYLDTGSDENNA